MRKIISIVFLWLLWLIPFVSANVGAPLSLITIPFYPLIVGMEVLVFWLLAKKWFHKKIILSKLIMYIVIANIFTETLSYLYFIVEASFFPYLFIGPFIGWLRTFISFILTIVIEWVIISFFYKKFFTKKELFYISFFMNLTSYLILIFFPYIFYYLIRGFLYCLLKVYSFSIDWLEYPYLIFLHFFSSF